MERYFIEDDWSSFILGIIMFSNNDISVWNVVIYKYNKKSKENELVERCKRKQSFMVIYETKVLVGTPSDVRRAPSKVCTFICGT